MKIISSDFSYSAPQFAQLKPTTLAEFAFAGRSNVGKSSLINTLLNRKNLAQTSKKPGKTRSINIYDIVGYDNSNRKSNFLFADLPGYGFARISNRQQNSWQNLMDDYIELRTNLRGFIIIVDLRHSLTKKDFAAINWIYSFNTNFLIVATKRDKLRKSKINKTVRALKSELSPIDSKLIVPFSSKTGYGKNKILNWINSRL